MKISSHHTRSPLLDPARSCQTCHRADEAELVSRAEAIQDRTKALMRRSEHALLGLIRALGRARQDGRDEATLAAARNAHRQAQWRFDFIAAENSMGFHAPQETARILGEAIDFAHCGRISLFDPEALDEPPAK